LSSETKLRRFPPYCSKCNTEKARRRSWIGHFFWAFCGRYVLGSVLVGVALYAGGLGAASACGFGGQYLRSRIWLFAAVIAWVFAWGERSDRHLALLPDRIRGAFLDHGDSFDALVRRWHRRLYSVPRSLLLGLALAGVFEYLTFYQPQYWQDRLPSAWSTAGHVKCAEWILTPYLLVGGVLVMTMILGFLDYMKFTFDILQHQLTFNVSLARAYLRPIALFGLETGLGWSVAVALSAGFLGSKGSSLATGVLVVLAVMGFILILAPQALAHQALAKTRDDLLVKTQRELIASDRDVWISRFVRHADEETLRLRTFGSELDQYRLWIYSPVEAMSFVAEVAGTIAAVVALFHLS
jgi:hypothetical protein